MAEVAYKSDINDLYAKIKADFTHALAISGTNLNLTRQLHTGDPLSPSGNPINCGTISKSDFQNWIGKGSAGGLAELDSNGLVPSSQLPSYVDDVVEGYLYNNHFYKDSAHTTLVDDDQTSGKIYVDLSNNKTYRWGSTVYVEISESLALGETHSTAYYGDYGKAAYDHATAKGSAFSSNLYYITTNSEGHVTAATAATAANLVSIINTTPVYRAVADEDGSSIKLTYATKGQINALDYSDSGYASGKYVSKVTQTDGLIDVTHASFVTPVVTMTDGTTSGPSFTVKATGGTSSSVTIPSANGLTEDNDTIRSGVVTTGAQSFAGDKTFTGNISGLKGVSALGIATLALNGGGGAGTLTQIQINGTVIQDVNGVVNLPLASTSADGAMSYSDKVKLNSIVLSLGSSNSWALTVGSDTITQGPIGTSYINALS